MEDFPLARQLLNYIKEERSNGSSIEFIENRSVSFQKDSKMRPKTAKKIGVISAGGGVGKTTTALNLAFNLRDRTFGKVVYFEGDIPNPNARICLKKLMVDFPEERGNLSQILQEPFGRLKRGELGRRNANGTLMELIDSKAGATTNPRILTFFSDLPSIVNVDKVYEQLFTTFERVSAHNPKNENEKRIDYIVCDFRAGSMSDPEVTKLMKYFDYRILVLIPDEKETEGIKNALRNDSNGEYKREEAFNILVFNRAAPGLLEEYAMVSKTEGKGIYQAKDKRAAAIEHTSQLK